MPWSGIGINYGHVSSYDSAVVSRDLTFLKSRGINKLRVAFPQSSEGAIYSQSKSIVQDALNAGFYVIWGLTAPSNFTLIQWDTHKAEVESLAIYAQSLNNPNFQFSVGNEEELRNNGDGAPDDATVRSDIKTLATTCQAIYTVGPISYQTSQAHISAWTSLGITPNTDIDRIGFNVYGTLNEFYTNVSAVVSGFGDNGQITEWNNASGYNGAGSEQVLTISIKDRLAILQASGVLSAYFFTYNHDTDSYGMENGKWNLLNEDGANLRDAFQVLVGGRRWFISS